MGKGNGQDCSSPMALEAEVTTDLEALEKLRKRFPSLTEQVEKTRWRLPEDRDGPQIWEMSKILADELSLDPVVAYQLDQEDFAVKLDAYGNPVEEDYSYAPHLAHLDPGPELIRGAEETMPGASEAAKALYARIAAGEKIAVFADYDIDGIGSAAVFSAAVEEIGGSEDQLYWRHASGGFGLTADFVRDAHAQGATMLVTLDCGSAQVGEIALAKSLGMETLIIDHHDADPTTDADHHLNPRYLNIAREGEPYESVHQARLLQERIDEAYRARHLRPDDPEVEEEFNRCVEEAREMIDRLDGQVLESRKAELQRQVKNARSAVKRIEDKLQDPTRDKQGDDELLSELRERQQRLYDAQAALGDFEADDHKSSAKLHLAIERAEQYAEQGLSNHNSAGQLTWKFGSSLIEASGKEVPADWQATPLYLAGQAALGDAMAMDSSAPENRAFVRIPVDSGAPVPPLIQKLCDHFGEDPSDPASMVRTRSALNLAKRTIRVDAKDIADGLRAKDDAAAERVFRPLLQEYERCRSLREDKMIPAALEDAKKRSGGKKKPMVASALLEGYPEDVGQARLLANKLAREYGVPAAVGVVDAQGVAKVSWAAPNNRLNFGQRALDQPKYRRMAKQACSFEETDAEGNTTVRYAVGGHTAVLSGSCPKERFEDFVAMGEAMGEQVCRQNERLWRKRPWDGPPSAFCDARMVGPERVHRIAEESKRLRPITDFRREPRVSEAIRLVELQDKADEGDKSTPAIVELSDGSRHQADLSDDVRKLLGSGTWFEGVISPARERWYISTIAPLG